MSEEKKAADDAGSPSTTRKLLSGKLSSKRARIIAVASIIVIAVSVLLIFNVTSKQLQADKDKVSAQKYAAFQKQSQTSSQKNDFAQQAREIEDYLKTSPSKEQQVEQLDQLSAAYMNAKDYRKAIEADKKLEQLDSSYAIASHHGQAMAYARLGEKQAAIDEYKKAIEAIKASGQNPGKTSRIAIDEASIRLLGGTP